MALAVASLPEAKAPVSASSQLPPSPRKEVDTETSEFAQVCSHPLFLVTALTFSWMQEHESDVGLSTNTTLESFEEVRFFFMVNSIYLTFPCISDDGHYVRNKQFRYKDGRWHWLLLYSVREYWPP
jgi:hypothetical protein